MYGRETANLHRTDVRNVLPVYEILSFTPTRICWPKLFLFISLCITKGKAEKRPYKTTLNIVNCKLTKVRIYYVYLC